MSCRLLKFSDGSSDDYARERLRAGVTRRYGSWVGLARMLGTGGIQLRSVGRGAEAPSPGCMPSLFHALNSGKDGAGHDATHDQQEGDQRAEPFEEPASGGHQPVLVRAAGRSNLSCDRCHYGPATRSTVAASCREVRAWPQAVITGR